MRIAVTVAGGRRLDAEYGQTLADTFAWERQFAQSAVALERAAAEARAAAEEDRPSDPALVMRTEWMLFFGWRRLREQHPGQLPAKFDQFLDELTDVDFIPEDDDVDDVDDSANGEAAVDPTKPEGEPVPVQ